ncbi:MAG: geopeptide radical SAM maturase [Deltaproteobacteria bacterium]|jgi:uncharacterized protein|nr:geopeptide radical SAM maturase [Deltaproteobacteria bacterium]
MVLSQYLKVFPFPEEPGYLLLYSTKNSAVALMPEEDYAHLQHGDIPEDYLESLTELGMLVADPGQEQKEVCSMLAEVNRYDSGLNVAVILGLACNFACVYCYEGSLKKSQRMTDETCEQLIDFLKKRYVARQKERLTLDFYGGEPLLFMKGIKDIAYPLKQFVEERDGEFRFSLVTNGSLLTRKVVEELLPAGLYGAKVTVDGPPDEHNRLRPFKSGEPSFDIILSNITDCCDLVAIGFGGNFTEENYKRVPELLDRTIDLGLTPDKLGSVQFHPVMQTADQYANPEFTGGCVSTNEPWVVDATLQVREEVLQRGYKTPKLLPSPCMVDLDDAFVINYDGRLYKCVAMIGHDKCAVGDVRKGFVDNYGRTYHLDHWRQHNECLQCEYLPLCFGGCRYAELQRTGSMKNIDCMRGFWEGTLERTIKQDIRFQKNIK